MTPPPTDPRGIHRALLDLARKRRADFNAICVQFALERLLHRLACSDARDRFVLKGAMLFRVWSGELHRPTKDIDLLGQGDPSLDGVARAVRMIAVATVEPDGITFDANSIKAREIRSGQEYGGVHVELDAYLGEMRLVVRIDIGFGDAITPDAAPRRLPSLLGHPVAELRTYPVETVVAEKLEAICTLGMANSRMKDFYDLLTIQRQFAPESAGLGRAIRATFERRGTALPSSRPTGLSPEFAKDALKVSQWRGFLRRLSIGDASDDLAEVIEGLWIFIEPALRAARLVSKDLRDGLD